MSSGVVLVVADDEEIAETCRAAFSVDHEIDVASDARVALDKMRYMTPALVVVDIQTDGAGGYSLCKDMRQDGRLERVPFVMLIGRTQDRWLAGQAGADRVLTKPVDVMGLRAASRSFSDTP